MCVKIYIDSHADHPSTGEWRQVDPMSFLIIKPHQNPVNLELTDRPCLKMESDRGSLLSAPGMAIHEYIHHNIHIHAKHACVKKESSKNEINLCFLATVVMTRHFTFNFHLIYMILENIYTSGTM